MRLRLTLATLVAIASIGIGCAHYHKPDGSLNVPVLLSDARWGFVAGCTSGWVSAADCTLGNDALTVCDKIAVGDNPGAAQAVRQALVAFEARLPPENKIAPYIDWVIRLLPQA